jgi:hypothetical protein
MALKSSLRKEYAFCTEFISRMFAPWASDTGEGA